VDSVFRALKPLKLGIPSAIQLHIFLDFAREFPLIYQKNGKYLVFCYSLVWIFTSRLRGSEISTTIHLHLE